MPYNVDEYNYPWHTGGAGAVRVRLPGRLARRCRRAEAAVEACSIFFISNEHRDVRPLHIDTQLWGAYSIILRKSNPQSTKYKDPALTPLVSRGCHDTVSVNFTKP